MNNFKWMHSSEMKETQNGLVITATPNSNCFVNPETGNTIFNAPFYYQDIDGDFVFQAKVGLEFITTYDAGVLLAYDNNALWAKACFEFTDLNTHAVVTVMTNGYSDDANCINVKENQVWLRLSRKGDVFAVHYSLDGEAFFMARLARLPMQKTIKVGIVAQSPLGQGGDRNFEFLSLELKTPIDIRTGK